METNEQQKRVMCGSLTGTECNGCEVVPSGRIWRTTREMFAQGFILAEQEDGDWPGFDGFCPKCGARLSFDADGKPTARRMVPEEETREEFLARARERGPIDFDAMRMDISDEEIAALGELPEREASVPMAALHKACEFLSSAWDCPFVHFGNIPCLKGLSADGPGSCRMTDENIAECWELYFAKDGCCGEDEH